MRGSECLARPRPAPCNGRVSEPLAELKRWCSSSSGRAALPRGQGAPVREAAVLPESSRASARRDGTSGRGSKQVGRLIRASSVSATLGLRKWQRRLGLRI